MKNQKYCIGLDIGTNSTGYAMTDMDGRLLKHHKRSTFGAILFDEASTAADRRIARSARRRLDRREQRIDLLQELLAEDMANVDSLFFLKLNESFLHEDDRKYPLVYGTLPASVWADGSPFVMPDGTQLLDEHGKLRPYPSIYHLRYALMHTNKKADIRYVYLALHHIIKYRGNFLMEGQTLSADSTNIISDIRDMLDQLKETLEEAVEENSTDAFNLSKDTPEALYDILLNRQSSRSSKVDAIVKLLNPRKENKLAIKSMASLIVGNTGSLKALFGYEAETPAEKLTFSNDDLDIDTYLEALGSNASLFEFLLQIYRWQLFCGLREPGETISYTMIKRYEKHQSDLKQLKSWFRAYANDQYNSFFREIAPANYVTYSGHYKRKQLKKGIEVKSCSQEAFYKSLSGILNSTKDEEAQAQALPMLEAMKEDNGFLPILRINFNGAIPNQLHAEELSRILDSQGQYYPVLLSEKEKIMSLCTFRLPYYVGPLNDQSPHATWIVRDRSVKARPWNLFDAIDKMATAEGFITNLTNKCTYLPDQDVLPLHSLLYEKYILLDELNRVTIQGKLIGNPLKQRIIEGLFMHQKTISKKAFVKWLQVNTGYTSVREQDIEHLHGESGFAGSLRTHIDFVSHGFTINEDTLPMLETLIRWSTIFEDRSILKEKIEATYPQLTAKQVTYICRRRYSGWGRLSETLLNGIQGICENAPSTVIEIMEATNDNFMKIINDKKYKIGEQIESWHKVEQSGAITLEEVQTLQGSPALKRGIWQAVKIVNELVNHQGHAPEAIYIENTRSDNNSKKGKRTVDRLARLEALYQLVDNTTDECSCKDLLVTCKAQKVKLNDRQYLYFLQLGKCLYSGKKLDFNNLEQYQIDHILPRSYIKDDSIDNRALVLSSENQRKQNDLLLEPVIQNRMLPWWRYLHQQSAAGISLISDKKFYNLTKTHVSDNEMLGFVNRQLVETSQIIKHVITLFKTHYPNTRVEGINAKLSYAIRETFNLYKIRELNDTHHAFDAFLACTSGTFTDRYLSWLNDESVAASKLRELWKKNRQDKENKDTNGIILNLFCRNQVDPETGEITREANKHIAYLKSVWNYKDHFIVRRKTEKTGQFYDETRYPAGSMYAKVPFQKNLPVDRYGGFNSVKPAYIAAVAYTKGKRMAGTLVNVPVMLVNAYEKDPNVLISYLLDNDDSFKGVKDIRIINPKILLNQKVEYDGSELLLKSCSEAWNGKQLYLSASETTLLYHLMHQSPEYWYCSECDLDLLYKALIDKLQTQYPMYHATIGNRLEKAKDIISNLTKAEKGLLILETVKIMQVSGNFAMYKSRLPVLNLSDNQGRITNKLFDISKLTLVDQSVTGFYEKRTKLWDFAQS